MLALPRSAGDVVERCVDAVLASQNRPKALRRWPSPGQPRSTAPLLTWAAVARSDPAPSADQTRHGRETDQ
jgi:hypothetical protein